MVSCHKVAKPTIVEVKDSVRHYYPIRQGQKLEIVYPIINRGKEPLIIEDIQPSCGCIVEQQRDRTLVMPGRTKYLHLSYDSRLNTGYVELHVRIFGNILPLGMLDLKFDLHVVPQSGSGYSKDYEEIFQEQYPKSFYQEAVDGDELQNPYYVGQLQ